MNFREQLSLIGIKISINDCIIKGVSLALKDHPRVNSGFNAATQTILQYPTVDISVAVSVQEGLITPIVRSADKKTLQEISNEVRQLAKKAKEGKLAPQEFQGAHSRFQILACMAQLAFKRLLIPLRRLF